MVDNINKFESKLSTDSYFCVHRNGNADNNAYNYRNYVKYRPM